jgi:hypothetical protein
VRQVVRNPEIRAGAIDEVVLDVGSPPRRVGQRAEGLPHGNIVLSRHADMSTFDWATTALSRTGHDGAFAARCGHFFVGFEIFPVMDRAALERLVSTWQPRPVLTAWHLFTSAAGTSRTRSVHFAGQSAAREVLYSFRRDVIDIDVRDPSGAGSSAAPLHHRLDGLWLPLEPR